MYDRHVASTSRQNGPSATPAPRRRRISAIQRREEILRAASEVFSVHGFHQTSIDSVAQAAGVSKALIYEHFSSKGELQETVLRQLTTDLFTQIAAGVAAVATDHDTDGRARLRAGIDSYFQFIEERRGAWHMLFRESIGRDASQVMLSLEPNFVSGIAAVLSEAPEAAPLLGTVEGGVRLRVGAQMLTGAMQWLGNWWVDQMELVPREQLVDWAMDSLWLGLEGWTKKLTGELPAPPAEG
jgi:AcrR family transcriptional regulator